MAFNAKVYWVLIASPGDLEAVRSAVAEEIYEWNNQHSEALNAVLIPRRWETDSTPGLRGRPQSMINDELVDQSDILVGLFWTRLGSPPGIDEEGIEHQSGTAEEIQRFVSLGRDTLIYFSSASLPQDIDVCQWEKLKAFKSELRGKGITFDYESVDDVRRNLEKHLTRIVRAKHKEAGSDNAGHIVSPLQSDPGTVVEIRNEYQRVLKRLKIAWDIARSSATHRIDEGQAHLLGARNALFEIRADPDFDLPPSLAAALDSALADMEKIQSHQLFIDGGRSFREFWRLGDEIIDRLAAVYRSIDAAASLGLDLGDALTIQRLREQKACLRVGIGSSATQIGYARSSDIEIAIPVTNEGQVIAHGVEITVASELDDTVPEVLSSAGEILPGETEQFRFRVPTPIPPPPPQPQPDFDGLYRIKLRFDDELGPDEVGCAVHVFGSPLDTLYGQLLSEKPVASPICGSSVASS